MNGCNIFRAIRLLGPPMLLAAVLVVFPGCEDPDEGENGNGSEAEAAPQEAAPQEAALDNGWRDGRDVAVLEARNNVVEWETRNIEVPPSLNRPGDYEWIIARIEGAGFRRLLIMTMFTDGGRRNPARISLDGPGGGIADGRFPVPLPGPTRWRMEYRDGALRISIDGEEIWSVQGNFTVDRAVMANSEPRGFKGQWRAVP